VTAVHASGIEVDLGGRPILEGVDFEMPAGTVTLLAGRNGSGKTTLLTVLAGLRAPDRGVVTLGDRDVGAIEPRTRARSITLIPQDADSPFEFTGRELVLMGRHPHISRFGRASAADHAAVDRALHVVNAASFADRPVTTLSSGERRRISIARALATEAAVLLADEPTANLDLDHAVAVLGLLRGLAAAGGTVLMVSHDLNLTAPYADRVALLHDGTILCVDEPTVALSPANVERVFAVRSEAPTGGFPRAFGPL